MLQVSTENGFDATFTPNNKEFNAGSQRRRTFRGVLIGVILQKVLTTSRTPPQYSMQEFFQKQGFDVPRIVDFVGLE
jgi:hypothetical protein